MIIDQLFTRPVFEAADPSRLIVSVRIEPMSTGGEPIDKEVDLTGQFQGSMGSQMNQALDYMKKMLESKDLYFTTLKVSYQGRILNMQNRGAMSPQSDEEREMDAMANQIRAKRQITTPTMKEEAPMASPEQIAYNQLRAQWNGYQAMTSGGGNTAVSRDPAHAAKLATVPAELARMAAALKAKGIDAEAQYDALSGPKSAPVDANQAYGLSENKSDPITQFASNAHEEWRRNFDPTGTKPRIKKNSDGTEGDINVPFADLHPDWQKENLAAAHAAHRAVKHFGRDMEKAAEYVHNEWMKRNPKADYNAAQHVPYDDLPQDEKEKDRVHVRTMMQLMGHSPEQGVAGGFSNDMSTEDMIAYLRQHHDTNLHQDYLDHINTFSKFVLKDIPVNSIKTDLPKLDRAKVEQYKQMDFSKAPPIVMGGGYILDGYHRANVAKALGIPTIKAYVGVKGQQGVAEGSDRVDSLVTDALKIMRGPEMSDAVLALKRVLGDRAYNERRGFYSFYVDKIHHMYGQQGMAEAFANPGSGSTGTSRGAKRIANTVRKALAKNSETPDQIAARKDFEAQTDARMRQKKKEQGVAESNTLMKKLHQALLQEGRVKELADDLKTLNDAEFMKKYGKNKAAIRRDMKKVDEGNANSGRRGPNSLPDNTPVKLGRVQKLKTGIKHHADSSRYGGTVPDTDDDHLLSPASRHRLHKAVTPDQQDLDEGNMPQSVIKSKQKYADMSDQEFHAAHKNKSEDDLKSMAWRHGYGKGSNHYVNRHKKGGGQLNELSTNKLTQYKTAAAADAKKADQAGDVKRGDKRFGGIVKATKKQFDNDAKKIDESRRARQALMAQIVNSR